MPPRGRGKAPVGRGRGRSRAPDPPRGGDGDHNPAPVRGGGGGVSDGDGDRNPSNTVAHAQTVAMRRPGHGQSGKQIKVATNLFVVTILKSIIHHYDVVIGDDAEKTYPARMNMEVISKLQNDNPQVFTPRAVYDSRKNLFSPKALPFGNAAEFQVTLGNPPAGGRQPRPYYVRLRKVAEINPEALARYIDGQQPIENGILTTITALHIVIRMDPSSRYPFNTRSFFTPHETKDIGAGIVLWRGYFQSVRPAVGRMLVNVDISTGAMHKPGNVLDVCLELLGLQRRDVSAMYAGNLNPRDALKLSRFLQGVRVISNTDRTKPPRTIRRIMVKEDASTKFELTPEGGPERTITVAQYFQETFRRPVTQPKVVLAEIGREAYAPLEFLEILPGQIMRKQVPSTKTKDMLDFATKRPDQRLNSIRNGLQVLNYLQSPYMLGFEMHVDDTPLTVNAHVLVPPTLRYGAGSKQPTMRPRDGAWNMMNKKSSFASLGFIMPSHVTAWAVVVYERQQRFNQQNVADLLKGMRQSAKAVGITGFERDPVITWENGQGVIADQLRSAGIQCKQATGQPPNLIVCILPEGATDVYNAIKHFGDISAGVATQCLNSMRCFRAHSQYLVNVLLKVNVKLGGVNSVPDSKDLPFLLDPSQPVLVIGAHVSHPPPSAEGRPSFSALVGNVDGNVSKYIATSRVQTGHKETIEDICEMTKHILQMYNKFRTDIEKKPGYPKRVVLYRRGVSDGQFKKVLNEEVPEIKRAFAELGISPPLTFINVGKRHHVRMFPLNPGDADHSGNCPSGTVIDTEIVRPTGTEFYLQSHGGQLDALQRFTFSLCHIHARSTRAVSMPSPVHYARIVTGRAGTHYEPQMQQHFHFADDENGTPESSQLDMYRTGFQQLHERTASTMYFM